MTRLTAIEFFSGIGAFSEATRDLPIDVIAAFDQSEHANFAFHHNFHLTPSRRNLDTISVNDLPCADVWWMSPPCTPYSRRGLQRDVEDPRAKSLLNLLELLPLRVPDYIFVENVSAFADSRACRLLLDKLESLNYSVIVWSVCSTHLGVPMRRPRFFIAATRKGWNGELDPEKQRETRRLSEFTTVDITEALTVKPWILERYYNVLDVVDPMDERATLICFTRGYYKCFRASGSLLKHPSGAVRYVAPDEILDLMGFSTLYQLPDSLSLAVKWKLLGNSVDVRAVKTLIGLIGLTPDGL